MLRRERERFQPGVVGTLVAVVVAVFSWWIAAQLQQATKLRELNDAETRMSTLRAQVERDLARHLGVLDRFEAVVLAGPDIEPDRLQALAERLLQDTPAIREIQLAPDAVVVASYPDRDSPVVGMDLRHDLPEEQQIAVELGIKAGQTLIDGPLSLVQGGEGLIVRKPVMLDESGFWGFVTIIIDVDSLEERLAEFAARRELRAAMGRTALDSPDARVLGDREVFDAPGAFTRELALPITNAWSLRALPAGETSRWQQASQLFIAFAMILSLLTGYFAWLAARRRLNMLDAMRRDYLTGCFNRQFFEQAAGQRLQETLQQGLPVSLLMIDIDHFKEVNDTHGHAVGDEVLRKVAMILRGREGRPRFVARMGGEEFAIMLPRMSSAPALEFAQHLVEEIAAGAIGVNGNEIRVTCSIGVATAQPDEHFERLAIRADGALYAAKRAGRNRAMPAPISGQ